MEDPAALAKLLSPSGWALLGALPPYQERLALPLSERLRGEGMEADLVAAALTQSRLRAKAEPKFGEFARGMLFTSAGLEQATRLEVAAQHARRYREAHVTKVADLTCGIGGDALAFAAAGLEVLAIEVDELTAAIATVNLRHFPEAEVRHGDSLALGADGLLAEGVEAVFADPARRTRSGSRRHDPRAYSPPLDAVLALRDRIPRLGVKVGPGIPHSALPEDAEAQWVSVDGDVVEAGLWFGDLAPDGPGRSALLLQEGRAVLLRAPAGAEGERPDVGPVGAFLYEPDGAVIRAGLVGRLATDLGGRLVDRTIAYITSDSLGTSPAARAYRVLDVLPFGLKRLRAYLRSRDVGRVTIKKRGTAVVPEQLRTQLDLRGSEEATIVLTRVAGAQHVIVVEPV